MKWRERLPISEAFAEGDLANSEFKRPPLFYTLYCVVYHHIFGLPGIQRKSPMKKLTTDEKESLQAAVISLSERVTQSKDPTNNIPARYSGFVAACLRQTDNIGPRKTRSDALFDEAF